MCEVKTAYKISADGIVGVLFGEQVMQEIRHEVYEVLKNHADDVVLYNWTLNKSYKEDGKQITISYPLEEYWWQSKDESIAKVLTASCFSFADTLYTDERDTEKVRELCGKVARDEIIPAEVME